MSRKRDNEKVIFRAFQVEPALYGGGLATWEQPDDEREFPDV